MILRQLSNGTQTYRKFDQVDDVTILIQLLLNLYFSRVLLFLVSYPGII